MHAARNGPPPNGIPRTALTLARAHAFKIKSIKSNRKCQRALSIIRAHGAKGRSFVPHLNVFCERSASHTTCTQSPKTTPAVREHAWRKIKSGLVPPKGKHEHIAYAYITCEMKKRAQANLFRLFRCHACATHTSNPPHPDEKLRGPLLHRTRPRSAKGYAPCSRVVCMRACMIVQTPFIRDNDVQMKLDFLQIKYYSIVMW